MNSRPWHEDPMAKRTHWRIHIYEGTDHHWAFDRYCINFPGDYTKEQILNELGKETQKMAIQDGKARLEEVVESYTTLATYESVTSVQVKSV